MWYFAWVLGLGFAVLLAILNALWLENADAREQAFAPKRDNDNHRDDGDGQARSLNHPQPNPHKEGTQTEGNPTEDISKTGDAKDNEIA